MIRAALAASAVALMVASCDTTAIRRHTVLTHDEQADVGTATMAVVAVERWDDIVSDLKPAFTMTGDAAVMKVLPTTQIGADRILSRLGLAVGVSTPTATLTSTETREQAAGATTPTVSSSEQRGETLAAATVPTLDAAGVTKATDLPDLATAGEKLEDQPLLQYQAALALFQEVKLLNRYVESAAQRHGFVPYLVRLQLSLTPFAARQPYDVYSHIGFFTDPGAASEACKDIRSEERSLCDRLAAKNPEVVPLVVTDDVEVAQQSRVVDVVRQLAASLTGNLQGANVAGQLNALNEQLQSLVGRTFNNLSTVSRLSDNTILARFGAVYDSSIEACWRPFGIPCRSADRSMVNRNFYVSLLVLVPEPVVATNDFGAVQLVKHTQMRDVRTGKTFGGTESTVVAARFNRIIDRYDEGVLPLMQKEGEWSYQEILPILSWVVTGDKVRVAEYLCKRGDCSSGRPVLDGLAFNSFWTEASTLAASFEIVPASIDLPRWSPPRLPETQLAILIDDGESGSRVRLGGVRGLDGADLAATLRVRAKTPLPGTSSDGDGYPLRAQQITLASSGRDLVLDFPSLGKLALDPTVIELDLWRVGDRRYFTSTKPVDEGCRNLATDTLKARFKEKIGEQLLEQASLNQLSVDRDSTPPQRYLCLPGCPACIYQVAYAPTKKANDPPPAKVSAFVSRIVSDKGNGKLRLAVEFAKDQAAGVEVDLVVAGADVTAAAGHKLNTAKNVATVAGGPGDVVAVTLDLAQLPAGERVVVTPGVRRGTVSLGAAAPVVIDVK